MRIDLHTHSSASDGTDPPAEVMRRARERGVDVVALTDHDTVAGHAEARAAPSPGTSGPAGPPDPPGLTFVPGMELSCHLDGRSLHLLAYLFDPAHPGLAAETATSATTGCGAPAPWWPSWPPSAPASPGSQVAAIAGDSVVGRPHIARAMADAGVISDPAEAFTAAWIGDGGRAYEDKYALDPSVAIGLVRDAGGVSVLAHPGTPGYEVPGDVIAALAAAGLAGVEVWHPEQPAAERARARALAAELGLAATGGSDDHGALTGYRIGCETTPPESWEHLAAQAS